MKRGPRLVLGIGLGTSAIGVALLVLSQVFDPLLRGPAGWAPAFFFGIPTAAFGLLFVVAYVEGRFPALSARLGGISWFRPLVLAVVMVIATLLAFALFGWTWEVLLGSVVAVTLGIATIQYAKWSDKR